MKRVTIQEARKLFDIGVVIYLLPSHTEYVPGIKISVFTNRLKDKDFDSFVTGYKAVSSNKMRYYVDEKEVEVAQRIYSKKQGVKPKANTKQSSKLPYSKEQLLNIGSNVASLWGAECYDCEVDEKAKEVIFHCIEHGEQFVTTLKFIDLKEYNY